MVPGPLSPTWASSGPSQAARVVIPGSLSWRMEGGGEVEREGRRVRRERWREALQMSYYKKLATNKDEHPRHLAGTQSQALGGCSGNGRLGV